jgi:phage baseplate assembly protein W
MTFEGLSSEMRSKVESAVSSATQLFEARVGFGVMEFVQTMDSAPFTVGSHSLHVRRFPSPAAQSHDLTEWVADVFSKNPKA